ncbi:hypothetical protein HPB51_001996 [Rhipicephalus microplus]|uniref:K Homology domain-containing protein n=1 Tax=Rhipicephalus microplus TaxID=6941 RepID=A0A9J6EWJ0_RHIMP|nr:hypothetical protein HPB51_001996 [Rhipicephalus microplus]
MANAQPSASTSASPTNMASQPYVFTPLKDPGTFCGTDGVDVDDWLAMFERGSSPLILHPTCGSSSKVTTSHGSHGRILSIVADVDTLGEILLNIIPKLDDRSMQFAQHTGQNGGSESEMRLLMHQSHAGCIIGRAGCRIKELRESTGANIKVHGSCCPGSTERIVKVTGSPSVVVDCIKQICDIVGQAPIKGLNKPYDPHNFDPEFAQEYGGFSEGATEL